MDCLIMWLIMVGEVTVLSGIKSSASKSEKSFLPCKFLPGKSSLYRRLTSDCFCICTGTMVVPLKSPSILALRNHSLLLSGSNRTPVFLINGNTCEILEIGTFENRFREIPHNDTFFGIMLSGSSTMVYRIFS